jgi:hypothetical protein
MSRQRLPLPTVLGTNEDFQQFVQVAFDAFTQHEAVVARKSIRVMTGPQDQIIGFFVMTTELWQVCTGACM